MIERIPSANGYKVVVGATLGEVKAGIEELLAAAQKDEVGPAVLRFVMVNNENEWELTLWGSVYT